MIFLMLVVSVVSAPTSPPSGIGDDDGIDIGTKAPREGLGEGAVDTGGDADAGGIGESPAGEGFGPDGPVETPDGRPAEENADDRNRARDGTPPAGGGPIPEFSTIGIFAAAAAGALGYMYMRKRRK
ncbi:hypothetical protein GF371_05165 [Candidatus Woesearchaeota archaeon]|nr:hypothetical protein [Candidatus Woesearchaeota archaeon]